MIEDMLIDVKNYFPLEIEEAELIGDVLNFHGKNWSCSLMCGWRLISNEKVVRGSYDKDIERFIGKLKGLKIVDITKQENTLIIDPVFILSDGKMIEVFSTDNFEPWTFHVRGSSFYSG